METGTSSVDGFEHPLILYLKGWVLQGALLSGEVMGSSAMANYHLVLVWAFQVRLQVEVVYWEVTAG
jgi:hypothetical protein